MGAVTSVPCCRCCCAEPPAEPAFRARGGAEPLLGEEGSLARALREDDGCGAAAEGGNAPQFLANPVPTVYKFVRDHRKRPTGPRFAKPLGGAAGADSGGEGAPNSEPDGAALARGGEPSAEQPRGGAPAAAPGRASLLGLRLPSRFAGPEGELSRGK